MVRKPLLTASTALLLGCSSSAGDGGTSPVPTVPTVKITGFAATGAPIPAGSAISAACVGESANTTSSPDGSYTLSRTSFTFPCLLRATFTSAGAAQTLYSIATEAGTAQITPLTHAILSAMSDRDLAAVFAAPLRATLDSIVAAIPATQDTLRTMLTGLGLGAQLTAVSGSLITSPLRPAFGTTLSDAHDLLLLAAAAKLLTTAGIVEALRNSITVDPRFAVRVDWTGCGNGPGNSANAQGTYEGIDCRRLIVLGDPKRHQNANGEIDMGPFDQGTGSGYNFPGRCWLTLSVSGPAGVPWAPSGRTFGGWFVEVRNARGESAPSEYASLFRSWGNLRDGTRLQATTSAQGAPVVQLLGGSGSNGVMTWESGGGGIKEIQFGGGTCVWATKFIVPGK